MSLINLTPTQLREAADLKEQIAGLEKQLSQLAGTEAVIVAAPATKPAKKGGMSAAGRARIAAAAKLRWAKINAVKAKAATVTKPAAKAAKIVKSAPAKPKRVISAAARAKMAAAAKLMWAKIRAAKAAKKK